MATTKLGTDKKGYGGDRTLASDEILSFPANADLDDNLANLLPGIGRRIYVGAAGDVKVVDRIGNEVTFKAVPVGTQLEGWAIVKILKTGTTATLLLVGL